MKSAEEEWNELMRKAVIKKNIERRRAKRFDDLRKLADIRRRRITF